MRVGIETETRLLALAEHLDQVAGDAEDVGHELELALRQLERILPEVGLRRLDGRHGSAEYT